MFYEVLDPGKAYLTYKVEDAPNTSYKAYLNEHGKSYTWLRRNRLANETEYKRWRERKLQDYDTYLKMYEQNYNASASQRARLESSNFSGQYLANGIGSSAASGAGVNAGLFDHDTEQSKSNGLNKVFQTLELMSAAGIAMKNFGEGKSALQYASDQARANISNTKWKTASEQWKGQNLESQWFKSQMEIADPAEYGYSWDPNTGELKFTDTTGKYSRNPYFEKLAKNLRSQDLTNALREREVWLKDLDYDIKKEYEKETAKARKELLEGKKALQDIEKEYASALKAMGIATPIIGALMKLL